MKLFHTLGILTLSQAQFNISPDLENQVNRGKLCARDLKHWITSRDLDYQYARDARRNRFQPFKDISYPECDRDGNYETRQCRQTRKYGTRCECVDPKYGDSLYAWIGSGASAKKVKINQDSIGDFFEAKGFNCKWFSPHYSVQSRKNAKFKIRNLEIFCDADFTNQKWCVQKGTLQCVNMRNCGGTKESCRCSDERCKYLKSLVKDAQC